MVKCRENISSWIGRSVQHVKSNKSRFRKTGGQGISATSRAAGTVSMLSCTGQVNEGSRRAPETIVTFGDTYTYYQDSIDEAKKIAKNTVALTVSKLDLNTYLSQNKEKYPEVSDRAIGWTVEELEQIVKDEGTDAIDPFIDSLVNQAVAGKITDADFRRGLEASKFDVKRDNETEIPGTYTFIDHSGFSESEPDKDISVPKTDGTVYKYTSPLDSAAIENALTNLLHIDEQKIEDEEEQEELDRQKGLLQIV